MVKAGGGGAVKQGQSSRLNLLFENVEKYVLLLYPPNNLFLYYLEFYSGDNNSAFQFLLVEFLIKFSNQSLTHCFYYTHYF